MPYSALHPSSVSYGGYSWQTRVRSIYRATKQHAFNLAKFVSIYKALLLLQRKANGGKERSADAFIAGLLGGYVVFGNRTAVNEQVCDEFCTDYCHPYPFSLDCALRCVACCIIFHSAGSCPVLVIVWLNIRSSEAHAPRFTVLYCVRRSFMGCSNVALQPSRPDDTARHVQFHDILVPGLGEVEEFEDITLAQHLDYSYSFR